jgi:hypothetical protein
MEQIRKILNQTNINIEDLINGFEIVKNNGDIAVIKFDGERLDKHYTVFISFPAHRKREMIRADENDLKLALLRVLKAYVVG